MMHGLLDTLINPSTPEDKDLVHQLKEQFTFVIVPMLNVDGVICGNYRCSLSSRDLNRVWQNPNKTMHPEVHATKSMCE